MKQEDFKNDFEENRKEVNLVEEDTLQSRSEKFGRKREPKKKSGNRSINIILTIFTLIPIIILIYVISDVYSSKPGTTAGIDNDNDNVQFETDKKGEAEKSKEKEEKEEKEDKEDKEDIEEEDTTPESETTPENEDVTTVPPVEDSQDSAEGSSNTPETTEQPNEAPKTHTVGTSENLYRIALKYYGNGSQASIEKIKVANKLTSNEVKVGQKIIIP